MSVSSEQYKKKHLIIYKNKTNKFLFPKFKMYGFRINESGYLSIASVEAARRGIVRRIRGFGSVLVCLKPSLWLTKKPSDVRMGKGKGNPYEQIILVKGGKFLFEWDGVSYDKARKVFLNVCAKIPLKASLVVNK